MTDDPSGMSVKAAPHSRACGPQPHDHGPACHTNCPTCGGKPASYRLPDSWLRERLRETLPDAPDDLIDSLVAVAEDYGQQLREARNG